MIYFVKWNRGYGNAINYDTRHNEVAYKYLLKAFYERTNKKEYELQILKHNIRYTNVIAIQDAILIAKALDESAKKNSLLLIHLMQRSSGYVMQQMFC